MLAVQFLYAWEANPRAELQVMFPEFFNLMEIPRDEAVFAEELVVGTIENLEVIDKDIRTYAQNWEFSRIARIDLAILRLAIYELLFRMDIPPVVSINEAIELGKIFSNNESKRFINGLLDRFKEKLQRPLRQASIE